MTASSGASGDTAAGDLSLARTRALSPQPPQAGEVVLWEARPLMRKRKMLELLGFLLMLGLLARLAMELIRPHLNGSVMAGNPDPASALPLILTMVIGTLLIIGLPVWLRSSARWRAHYMLTNRRALIWLGNRIVGEAVLFGSDMRVLGTGMNAEVNFVASNLWLDWRLKDQGVDRVRFEQISDAPAVAALAEAHGARWIDRPPATTDE